MSNANDNVPKAVHERPVVIFDYDGTVANTTASIIATSRKVLAEWGMTDEEMGELRRLVGPPMPAGYSIVYGVPEADAIQLCARYRELYAQLGPEAYPLFDGMAELLGELKSTGRRLAIASSKKHELVCSMLRDQGIFDLFEVVQGQTELAFTSGKAGLIGHVLERLGVTSSDAVMVGDRDYDALGAAEVGVPCVGVLFGTAEREELERAGVVAIANDCTELARILLGDSPAVR